MVLSDAPLAASAFISFVDSGFRSAKIVCRALVLMVKFVTFAITSLSAAWQSVRSVFSAFSLMVGFEGLYMVS